MNITTFKTESMIHIKWGPPPTVSCESIYKYLVAYKHDSRKHYEEVAKCEYMLTNLNPDTLVKFFIRAVCTCPSSVYGKSSILSRHTSKIHIYTSLWTYKATWSCIAVSRPPPTCLSSKVSLHNYCIYLQEKYSYAWIELHMLILVKVCVLDKDKIKIQHKNK